jgi:hypothetical protein
MSAALLFGGRATLRDQLSAIDIQRPTWLAEAAAMVESTGHENYWHTRLGLGGKPMIKPASLLGPDRIATMITNTIAPWLLARTAITEADILRRLADLAPDADNAVIRQMAFNLLGHDHNPALLRTGLRQQGLIHLFYEFCLNARSGCATCRLPESLAEVNALAAAGSELGRTKRDGHQMLRTNT